MGDVPGGQIEQLARRLGCGKGPLGLDDLAQLAVVALNRVGCVNQVANLGREVEKDGQFGPVVFPGTHRNGILLTPLLTQLEQVGLGLSQGNRLVDAGESDG